MTARPAAPAPAPSWPAWPRTANYKPGQVWRQEGIVGSIFEGSIEIRDGCLYPRIRGSAYITGEATLVLDPHDPFVHGIPSIIP